MKAQLWYRSLYLNVQSQCFDDEFGRTRAVHSVGQEGRHDDVSLLAHTHAQQALLHALDEVTLSQVGVVRCVPPVTSRRDSLKFKFFFLKSDRCVPKTHPKTASPGVKGLAGEQGAVVLVADEVRRRRRAVTARRFGHNADVHLVFGIPNVQ